MNIIKDLILIRHEEAEGNEAMVKSKFHGDDSGFTMELRGKPSDTWYLTSRGKERCVTLGNWIRHRVPLDEKFQFAVSPSVRTIETASLILPQVSWTQNELLRGRKLGGIECLPWNEWPTFCRSYGHETIPSGFHQAYPNGEAMVEVWKRVGEFVNSLTRNTLVVTHGEVLLMARMLLESVPESDHLQLERNGNHVRNGQTVWYSKRNPVTGECFNTFRFKRTWFDEIDTGWIALTPR